MLIILNSFLHDIVTSILEATSFPENYFSQDELNSKHFQSKEDKIKFLNKLIKLVNASQRITLEVNPSKVVSGLDPVNTNILLIELARAASNTTLDRAAITKQCLQTDQNQQESNLNFIEYQDSPLICNELSQDTTNEHKIMENKVQTGNFMTSAKSQEYFELQSSLSSRMRNTLIERTRNCNYDFSRTRQEMEKLVKRPRCTQKLLKKPPFRFLHDLIIAVMNKTGFGSEVFR